VGMRRSSALSKWILYALFLLAAAALLFTLYPSLRGIRVSQVVDGDTVVLNDGETVRYIGIDTPEHGEAFFDDATEANRELVQGKKLTLEYDIDRQDRYGRSLAYVWVDTLLVNAALIRMGLASIYTFLPNVKHRKLFLFYQKEAREKGLGIWSSQVAKEQYYVASKRSGRFIFHRPDCQWATRIKKENLIRFDTREAALDSGYSPCRSCKP
jgi:micrococcal nuclease